MPPFVDVLGVVVELVVSVLVDAPLLRDEPPLVLPLLLVPKPVEPPPLVTEVPLEPELEPVFELELTFAPEVALEPPLAEEEFELPVAAVAWVDGDAVLVVGTVSIGAPAVSLLPWPLPPQAATTSAASTAAAQAEAVRRRRICT